MANGNDTTKTAWQPAQKPTAPRPPVATKPPLAPQRGVTVQLGECFSTIALKLGFKDYKPLYDHGANAALKAKRPNPNQLMPGDTITPPPKQDKSEAKSTGQSHKWVVPTPAVALKLIFLDPTQKPLKGRDCEVKIGSTSMMKLKTNAQGMLDIGLPFKEVTAVTGEILINLEEPSALAANTPAAAAPVANTPPRYPMPINTVEFKEKSEDEGYIGQFKDDNKLKWMLQIGAMPPHEEPLGVVERLRNLGFDCGSETVIGEKTKRAIIRFLKTYYPNESAKKPADVNEKIIKDIQNRLKEKHDNP